MIEHALAYWVCSFNPKKEVQTLTVLMKISKLVEAAQKAGGQPLWADLHHELHKDNPAWSRIRPPR